VFSSFAALSLTLFIHLLLLSSFERGATARSLLSLALLPFFVGRRARLSPCPTRTCARVSLVIAFLGGEKEKEGLRAVMTTMRSNRCCLSLSFVACCCFALLSLSSATCHRGRRRRGRHPASDSAPGKARTREKRKEEERVSQHRCGSTPRLSRFSFSRFFFFTLSSNPDQPRPSLRCSPRPLLPERGPTSQEPL